MSCFKYSKNSILSLFKRKGLIRDDMSVVSTPAFNVEVDNWTKYSTNKYGTTEPLFTVDNGVAVPNEKIFQIIDWKKGVKYPENEWVEFPEVNSFEEVEDVSLPLSQSKLYNDLLTLTGNAEEAERLYLQTKTPEFRQWFGDSKVVDENGEPLIVYHGGVADIKEFDPNRKKESAKYGKGFYFTSNKRATEFYRELLSNGDTKTQTYAVFLNGDVRVEDPYGDGRNLEYIVQEANQIKSVFNTGTFDTSNNIYLQQSEVSRKQLTPEVRNQLLTFLTNVNPDFRVEVIDDLSVNGLTQISEFLIQLKRGKENLALGEEASHVFVELLSDQKLKKDLLSDVQRTRMYQWVIQEYGQVYGMDYNKLQREAAAKLISLYIQDKSAFKYWSGSDQLTNNLGGLIQRLINWVKRNFKNPYSKSALRILKGSTDGIDTALANESSIFYQLDNRYYKFESIDVDNLTRYDKVFINLNNTILDYKSYVAPASKGKTSKAVKSLFFGDTGLRSELDHYYANAKLTNLGKELKDKIGLLNPNRVAIFTDAPITDTLVERLEDEFGQVSIVRTGYNIQETVFDEFGNPVDRLINGSEKESYIKGIVDSNPRSQILFVDNQSTALSSENYPNLNIRTYRDNERNYVSVDQRVQQEVTQQRRKEFSEAVVDELSSVNKDNLLQMARQSMNMVRNHIAKLEKGEGLEELSELFKDEYGNLSVPLDENLVRLLGDVDTFNQGLLSFVNTIESTRYFFKKANDNNFSALRDLISTDDPQELDKAIREVAVLMRMILSWKEWVDEIRPYTVDTKVVKGVIKDLNDELETSRTKLNSIAVNVLSKSFEEQWRPHNQIVEKQYQEGIISKEIRDTRTYTAQKLADWLYGIHGDVHTGSAYFENPLMQSEPVIQAISRRLEMSMIGADYKVIEGNFNFANQQWEIGEKIGLSDEEIGKRLTFTDQDNYWEDGQMKQRDTLYLLNAHQGTWQRDFKDQQLRDLYNKFKEAKNAGLPYDALEAEYKNQKKEFELWLKDNWYDELTNEGKDIYKTFGIDDEILDLAKERQKVIFDQMNVISRELKKPMTEYEEDSLNAEMERLVRELRLLRNEYDEEGNLKEGEDLLVAMKLKEKSLIDRQINDYELDKNKFLDSIREQIVSIADESVKSTLLSLLNVDNLSSLRDFAKSNAPQKFLDWLDRNTRVRFSDNFYEERSALIKQIKELSNSSVSEQLDQLWKEITNMTSYLRDKDMLLDASDSNPVIQRLVKDYESTLELIKEGAETNSAIIPLIQQLSEIQTKSPSKYYEDTMYDKLKDIYPGISSNTNWAVVTNSLEFKRWLNDEASEEFKNWFDRNHIVKSSWDSYTGTKMPKLVPTYIWMKIEPTDTNDILVIPSWKYNKRILKDSATVEYNGEERFIQLKTPKIDWVTWNPVERKWLPKGEQFRNKEYERLKNSKDPKDKLLFEYLTKLTNYHLGIQYKLNKDGILGFKVPYMHTKYTEGKLSNGIKRVIKSATDTLQAREEGTGGDESKKKNIIKKVLAFSGIQSEEQEQQVVRTDYLGNKFKTVYTPYTMYLTPEETTKNLVVSITNYANGAEKVKAMIKDLPQLTLLEQIFNAFKPKKEGTVNQYGQQVDAGTNNRFKLLQHIVDSKLYSDNKNFELGKDIDKFLVGLRKTATYGTQSDLNVPNSIKNWLQGQLMNLLFVRERGWATRRTLLKAMRDHRTSYANFINEMGKKNKSVDYHILSFFNPNLEKRTIGFSRGDRSFELQDRAGFLTGTASEFSVMSTLLYSHLYNQDVMIDGEKKKLYDAFTVVNGRPAIKANTTLDGRLLDENYIQDLKLRFKMMMEDVQGKQWNQTMAQRYTVWQSIEFFKRFFITMLRKRFFFKRENIELGETEGIYITTFKWMIRLFHDFLRGTKYSTNLTPEEKRRLVAARDEFLLALSTLFIISFVFGFDEDDEDKYEKLSEKGWLENMALLIAINTKRETDSLTPFMFTTIQNSIAPPILNETYNFITEPFVGFGVINEGRKMLDALLMLATGNDKAYYERDMPQYLIEEGDSKFQHYLLQVTQLDNFLYQKDPASKIQVIVQAQNR